MLDYKKLILFFGLILTSFLGLAQTESECLSSEEKELIELIQEYRRSKNLPEIPVSASLTIVARTHIKDLSENNPVTKRCNLHSWSSKGKWKKCCYRSGDEKSARCMWNKPSELTDYSGYGYEIAFYHSEKCTPQNSLEGWKSSKGHRTVIINQGMWKDVEWQAMGVAIQGNYAVVWFGENKDDIHVDSLCDIQKEK